MSRKVLVQDTSDDLEFEGRQLRECGIAGGYEQKLPIRKFSSLARSE